MLGRTNPLHLLKCLLLALPHLVSSQPPPLYDQQAASNIHQSLSAYKVTCLERSTQKYRTAKLDCQALIQNVLANPGPSPDPGSTAWKEGMSRNFVPLWTASSRFCSISISTRNPFTAETWNTVKEGIREIAHDCIDQEGFGGRRDVVEGRGPPFPESPIVRIWPTKPDNNPTYSPPIERVTHRTCTHLQSLREPLTARQKEMVQACCKMAVGFCALLAGAYVGPGNSAFATGAVMAGAYATNQGVQQFSAARRPELRRLSSPESPRSPSSSENLAKRRRDLYNWKREVLLAGDMRA